MKSSELTKRYRYGLEADEGATPREHGRGQPPAGALMRRKPVKVAFGQLVLPGPWGGGNQFVTNLAAALKERGDSVVYDLAEPGLDIILMIDPRSRNPAVTFTPGQVQRAILGRQTEAVVIHRINECDQRKGTRTMNLRLRLANTIADHTVFIGSWLRDLRVWQRGTPATVILNGADARIFNAEGLQPWDGVEPLRLVTHHWGGHEFKGFDVYRRIDAMLAEEEWKDRIQFTYIGNLPSGFTFTTARHLPPRDGPALAEVLRNRHVYVTASINEPAGMHHIEGVLCGLPVLYRDSGALPEYCAGFGEVFTGPDDFETALRAMMKNYLGWAEQIAAYPYTASRMCRSYLALFDDLMARRDEIVARRRPWHHPFALALNQVPW